jgi:hypothetical protein
VGFGHGAVGCVGNWDQVTYWDPFSYKFQELENFWNLNKQEGIK